MNFNQLHYLRVLVQYGSFSLAARELDISQPALSTQIRLLEDECELQLIDRSRKPLELSPEGQQYFQKTLQVLQGVDELLELPYKIRSDISGELRLGIIPTLAPYLIPFILGEMHRRHPELDLIIEEELTEGIASKIKSGHLHAGILSTPVQARGLAFRALFYEKFFLYISEKHPLYEKKSIGTSEIDLEEVWYLQEGNCFSNQVNALCRLAGRQDNEQGLQYYSNSIESLRRIVEGQGGMTFIPELATLDIPSEQEDLIRELEGEGAYREISLVSTPGFLSNHRLEAFAATCLSQLPSHMQKRPEGWVVDTDIRIKSN